MDNTLWITLAGVVISALVSFIISSMKIGEYKNKVDTAVGDIGKIEAELKEIRDKVIACETSLKEREPITKRKSPVTLTERGSKILAESGGRIFIDSNYPELKKKVEDTKPQTSYDIQETSHAVIDGLKDDTRINGIKEYLFKEGMELSEMVDVLAIYLRDKILEERHIAVEDVDTHTPKV